MDFSRKLEASPIPSAHRNAGDWVVIHGSREPLTARVGGKSISVTGSSLALWLHDSDVRMAFSSSQTATAAVAMIAQEPWKRVLQMLIAINNPKVVLIDRALSQAFWLPDRMGFEQWCSLMGWQSNARSAVRLLAMALEGYDTETQEELNEKLEKLVSRCIAVNIMEAKIDGWLQGALLTVATQMVALSEYRTLVDPIGVVRALEFGDAITGRHISTENGIMDIAISSPCRVKTGRVLIMGEDMQSFGGFALQKFRWDDELKSIVAQVVRPGRRSKAIPDLVEGSDSLFMVGIPRVSSPRVEDNHWTLGTSLSVSRQPPQYLLPLMGEQ